MAFCPNFNSFTEYVRGIKHKVLIDRDKDKELRYDVWSTTADHVKSLFKKGVTDLPGGKENSQHIITKIENALMRVDDSVVSADEFAADIIDDDENIAYSIALYELIESVKGESDKARNLGIELSKISNKGILPALPLARVAAVIGRKIAFQQGYRFKSDKTDRKTAAEIETMYYAVGNKALLELEKKGYVVLHEKANTIKDYLTVDELKKKFTKTGVVTNKVLGVSLAEDKLGFINPEDLKGDKTMYDTAEVQYFVKRSVSDISDTKLGVITDMLGAVRQITQPATIVVPDKKNTKSMEDLAELDDPNITLDEKTEIVRKKLYDNPLYVHSNINDLVELLHERSIDTGKSGSKIIKEAFKGHDDLINSLFGLKRSDDHSIDKKESVAGQNLSKTTPLDDFVENFKIIQGENTEPAPLHMPLKDGRNARLYVYNSVLNPHGSKHSRYSLTPGQYTVDSKGDDFDSLVYGVYKDLGDKNLTYTDIVGETESKLDEALDDLKSYEKSKNLDDKLSYLSDLAMAFPGVDYASLLTSLTAISDIRNPKDGKIHTQYAASADAIASGGTLTFVQALGTNDNVEDFLKRIGLLKGGDPDNTIDDLYGIMTEAIGKFTRGEKIPKMMGQDKSASGMRAFMEDTVDMLFGSEPDDVRDMSKSPTMTFVYGQQRKGAIETMSRSLADRIVDNLEDPKVKKYIKRLFGDNEYDKNTEGFYKDITTRLNDIGLPGQLYDILDAAVNKQFLQEYKARSERVATIVAKLPTEKPFKMMPAGAKMSKIRTTEDNLKKYGMPLTKIVESMNPTYPGQPDTVLTRIEKLMKTVADVSPIHSIDAAQLYHSLHEVMTDSGVVVVHDEVRGTVQLVRAMEEEYRKQTLKILSTYDVHNEILKAVQVYSPELSHTAEFTELQAEIKADMDAKKKILNTAFNDDTHALIGEGNAYKTFANPEQEATPTAKASAEAAAVPEPTAMDRLTALAGKSKIITKFLNMANKSDVEFGKIDEFIPVSDTIKVTEKATKENIEHEITHANTVAYIAKAFENKFSQENREVRYFKKAIDQLQASTADISEETAARISYIVGQGNEVDQVAEFVAVMESEPATATEIYNILSKETPSPTLMKRIKAFVEKVKASFISVSDEDFAKNVDIEKLYSSLMNTVAMGETQREQNYNEAAKYLTQFNRSFKAKPEKAKTKTEKVAAEKAKGTLNYLNYAVASILGSKLESGGKKLLGNMHSIMNEVFPMYTDVANKMAGIYDESEALQQLLHTITGQGVDKTKKADILAKFAEVMGQQTEVVNLQMGKFHKLLSPLSDKERTTIGRFVTDMPLHDYFVLASEIVTVDAIASEVTKLEKLIRKTAPNALRDINDLIAWNVMHDEKSKGRIYNLETSYPMDDSDFGDNVRKLLALKSIQTIGSKDFVKLLENTDLVNLIKDTSIANRISLLENDGASNLTDSMVPEYYKEPFQLKAVEKKDLKMYENGENTGWKVLEMPTENTLGVVYRNTIDSTSIPGAFTDTKLSSTDITVTGKKSTYYGVVETKDGHKLRISRANKLKLGLVEDFSQGLVKGTAHSMAIQESQIIRDELLKDETRIIVGNSTTKLENIVKADNVDNPWFVKFKEGISYSDMPKSIRAKYTPVGARASNVKGFNEEVDLVRKDISHWLLGGSARSLFTNPQMKWAMRITKNLIAGAKIGMVVMNPVKIAQDNVSNVSYLGAMGVDPIFITKNYKNITVDFQEYSDLQRQILQLKVQLTARPESPKIKKQIKALQDRLSRNSLGDLTQKGFINSLGSDLVAKNADTLSGLQADMYTALHYLLTNKEGKKNYVSHFIMQLQNLGFNGEDFLTYIGKIAQKTDAGKGVQKELDQVAERLKEIRTEQDIVNYVSQYTNSPGSEAVRLGSAMTDLTDVLAKETLYRHLVENENSSPEAARIKVLDSFPDYKENMPLAVKQLSDVGIIMFPSFWLRIQKVIYRLGRDKPINLATELMLEEALGSDINTIIDANIINKSNTFGGIFHTPFEPMGVGSAFPTHLW